MPAEASQPTASQFSSLTTEAGEKAAQYRNVFAASFVFFILACVRTLFTTWAPLGSIHKAVAYLGAQVVNGARNARSVLFSMSLITPGPASLSLSRLPTVPSR
jgi:hypothetical protein